MKYSHPGPSHTPEAAGYRLPWAPLTGKRPGGGAHLAAAEDIVGGELHVEVAQHADGLVPGPLRAVQRQAAALAHLGAQLGEQ